MLIKASISQLLKEQLLKKERKIERRITTPEDEMAAEGQAAIKEIDKGRTHQSFEGGASEMSVCDDGCVYGGAGLASTLQASCKGAMKCGRSPEGHGSRPRARLGRI